MDENPRELRRFCDLAEERGLDTSSAKDLFRAHQPTVKPLVDCLGTRWYHEPAGPLLAKFHGRMKLSPTYWQGLPGRLRKIFPESPTYKNMHWGPNVPGVLYTKTIGRSTIGSLKERIQKAFVQSGHRERLVDYSDSGISSDLYYPRIYGGILEFAGHTWISQYTECDPKASVTPDDFGTTMANLMALETLHDDLLLAPNDPLKDISLIITTKPHYILNVHRLGPGNDTCFRVGGENATHPLALVNTHGSFLAFLVSGDPNRFAGSRCIARMFGVYNPDGLFLFNEYSQGSPEVSPFVMAGLMTEALYGKGLLETPALISDYYVKPESEYPVYTNEARYYNGPNPCPELRMGALSLPLARDISSLIGDEDDDPQACDDCGRAVHHVTRTFQDDYVCDACLENHYYFCADVRAYVRSDDCSFDPYMDEYYLNTNCTTLFNGGTVWENNPRLRSATNGVYFIEGMIGCPYIEIDGEWYHPDDVPEKEESNEG